MTRVVVGGSATRVVVAAGSPTQIRLDARTVARIDRARPVAHVVASSTPVQVEQHNTVVQTGGAMGVQGPPGSSGSGDIIAAAGAALSALRVTKVVAGVAAYADSSVVADAALITGITVTAAASGASITIRTDGELHDATWSWSPGPIYCGVAGALTQIVPTVGFIGEVARALNATTIVVDVQTPTIRG